MKVSIVTITFNAADTLQPTLDSVASQTYDDVEHLIIDGASTDSTVAIAQAYLSEATTNGRHEVRMLSEPDNGLYDAMNKGLRLATGDYILFLNAGDRLPAPDTLARVMEVATMAGDGDHPAVLYGDTDIIGPDGKFISHRHLSPPQHLTWRSFRHGMLVCHQAFYARTDLARETPYDTHYRYSADVDWCIRIMRKAEDEGASLVRIPGVVALYLNEGETTRHHRESLRERFEVMRHHYGLATTLAMHAWFAIRRSFK
jgi:glycosyltransferase involved in cell wall biosynthesis